MRKKSITRARRLIAEVVEVWDGPEVSYHVVREIKSSPFKIIKQRTIKDLK